MFADHFKITERHSERNLLFDDPQKHRRPRELYRTFKKNQTERIIDFESKTPETE